MTRDRRDYTDLHVSLELHHLVNNFEHVATVRVLLLLQISPFCFQSGHRMTMPVFTLSTATEKRTLQSHQLTPHSQSGKIRYTSKYRRYILVMLGHKRLRIWILKTNPIPLFIIKNNFNLSYD